MKKDKFLHLLAGTFWAILFILLGYNFLIAFCVVFALAITKELLDKLGNGVVDSFDFIYTIAGLPVALLLIVALSYLV